MNVEGHTYFVYIRDRLAGFIMLYITRVAVLFLSQ